MQSAGFVEVYKDDPEIGMVYDGYFAFAVNKEFDGYVMNSEVNTTILCGVISLSERYFAGLWECVKKEIKNMLYIQKLENEIHKVTKTLKYERKLIKQLPYRMILQ